MQAEERLRYLAEHDDLTGLHNRRALLDHLDVRLAAGGPGPVSALYLDLDRLKTINDYLGHNVGDWFIRVLAERLQRDTGDSGVIARLGGDEFVVIPAAPMSSAEAEQLASRLLTLLSERVPIDGEMLTRTVSIGVALGTPGRDSTSDLLRRADQAVLSAKARGRKSDRRVLRRDVIANRLSQRHRTSPSRRHRERRSVPAVPTRDRHAHRRGARHRGVGAVESPHPRPVVTRRIHRRRRIDQPGWRLGSLGVAGGMCGVRKVARLGRRRRDRPSGERVAGSTGDRRIRGVGGRGDE